MIVCKNCGHQNQDNDTFCGSCGKFLEWTGERVAVAEPEPAPPPPPPPAPSEPSHVGLIDRVKHAVGIEETEQGGPRPAPPAPAAAVPPPAAPAPAAAAPPPPAAPRPVPIMSSAPPPPPPAPSAPRMAVPPPAPMGSTNGDPVSAREPVLAGVGAPAAPPTVAAPTRDDEPMSRRPTSVAPAVARPRPAARTMEAPTRRRPGDLICGQCGEGNDPTRHFCRRCGNTLDEALAIQLPWYRRFWNRLFGQRTYAAGYRHGRIGPPNVLGGLFRIVRLALLALVVILVAAFALIPNFRTGVINRVSSVVTPLRVQFFPHYDAIYATGADASTSIPGHPQTLVIDHYVNTYWAAAPNDPRPSLTIHFHDPVDIAEIGFDSGPSGTGPMDAFPKQPRPHSVHVVCSDGTTKDLTLRDEDPAVAKNAQFYSLDAKQVTYVEIFINTTYAAPGAPSSVAISEVEFKTRD